MGTTRVMNAECSKSIGVYFKCQYCENENFQLQKITARGSAQANGSPWSQEAKKEQTSRLVETAKSEANTNLKIIEQEYEKSINQYRRLWGVFLMGECQKCGKKQIWDQLESIHYGIVPIIFFVVGSIIACLYSGVGEITTAYVVLLLSLLPVGYIIYQGILGFQKVKKLQNLDQRYYPIIVTHEKLDSFLVWKNDFTSEHSGIAQEKTKSYNKPIYVILQMLKSICLIWGITSLFIGAILGYHDQIKVPIEYQQYDYMSENDQYVFFDAVYMAKIGQETVSKSKSVEGIITKVYFYLVDEKGNEGIASMRVSEAPEELNKFFYGISLWQDDDYYYDDPHRLYGKTRSVSSDEVKKLGLPEGITILEVSKEEIDYVMVDDLSHLSIGMFVTYIGIVFIIVYAILKIRQKLNEKKGGI